MSTELLYLEKMHDLTCSAEIDRLIDEEKCTIILNQTVFYPQGGGQPYDTGTISTGNAVFQVDEVRIFDGEVHHIGTIKCGRFQAGDGVHCQVDGERRAMHTRLHSAGHIVDMGLEKLGISWIPSKGYHFPDGPYVEYEGMLDDTTSQLKEQLEHSCNEIIKNHLSTEIRFMNKEDVDEICRHVPRYIPENTPARVVMYGDFGVPCGGTHVKNLRDIGNIVIRKIKQKKHMIKIGYSLA